MHVSGKRIQAEGTAQVKALQKKMKLAFQGSPGADVHRLRDELERRGEARFYSPITRARKLN